MARNDSSKRPPQHGLNDLIGVGVLGLAFLLLLSLVSYDPKDLPINGIPANKETANWIGPAGAGLACGTFWAFGIAAYLVPLLLVPFALAYWLEGLQYLKRRWPWGLVLLLASAGLLDLYKTNFESLPNALNLPGAGGLLGDMANRFFKYFGLLGATTLFGMLYLFSLYGLTDLQLGVWLRAWWLHRKETGENLAAEEKALENALVNCKSKRASYRNKLENKPTDRRKNPPKIPAWALTFNLCLSPLSAT